MRALDGNQGTNLAPVLDVTPHRAETPQETPPVPGDPPQKPPPMPGHEPIQDPPRPDTPAPVPPQEPPPGYQRSL